MRSMEIWKPSTTVAAIVEREGKFLMIEEETRDGVRLNQPAGHLDEGESLEQAVVREALEESAYRVSAQSLLGVYMSRHQNSAHAIDVTYLRFAFVCRVEEHFAQRALDKGILKVLWLSRDEIVERLSVHRSPLVMQCVDDYVAGRRFPLNLIK